MLKPGVQRSRKCSIFVAPPWPQGVLLTKGKGMQSHASECSKSSLSLEGDILYYWIYWKSSAHGNEKLALSYFSVGKFSANSAAPDYLPSVTAPAAHLGTARMGRTGVGVTPPRLTLRIVIQEFIPWLSVTFLLASKLSPAEWREGCQESHCGGGTVMCEPLPDDQKMRWLPSFN